MNKTVKVAFVATLLSSTALSGAAAHIVKKGEVYSIYPWVEALRCSDAAAGPAITAGESEPFSLYDMKMLATLQAMVVLKSRALASVEFPDHDPIESLDGSTAFGPIDVDPPRDESLPAPVRVNFVESEEAQPQVVARPAEPLPDTAAKQPAKAKPRRPAPADVRQQQLPVSLIWSPGDAAGLTASMSLAWNDPSHSRS